MTKKKTTKKKSTKKVSKNKKAVAIVKKTKVGRPKKNESGQILNNTTGKYQTGRPTKITDTVVKKLEDAFGWGATDLEACAYAGISKTALYEFQKEYPEFKERKKALKELTILHAKKTVSNTIQKDFKASQWYLGKKLPDEFGDKPDGGIGVQINTLIADKKKKYDI